MCSIMGFSKKTRSREEILPYFARTRSRGPDMSRIVETPSGYLCFHRLAIMDLSEDGMQPFSLDGDYVVCNGELYGFRSIRRELAGKYTFHSNSDCEILLPMFHEYGLSMFSRLDAEFALIIYDSMTDSLIAARDPIGIRPLFYGYDTDGGIVFASEAKNLVGLCKEICPFPPGHYYAYGKFVRYADLTTVREYLPDDEETICRNIRNKLIAAVDKRLDADAPLGFLLSGGLDSSLVCAISAIVLGKKIRTFAIGMDTDAIDLKYARQAAEFIGADHTEFYMTRDEVLESLEEVIALLGTWDITTIRASMGMYLCCKAIHTHTDVRVLLTGEISDELFGYKYTDFAPATGPSRLRPKSGWMSCICTMCSGPTGVSPSTPWRPGSPSAIWTSSAMSCRWTRPASATPTAWANTCCARPLTRTTSCPTPFSGGRRPPSPTPWATPWWTISRPTPRPATPTPSLPVCAASTTTARPSPRRACSTGRSLKNITPARLP